MTATPSPGSRPRVAQVEGGERHQLVAVHDRALAVHGEHAVAVAVEGEADVVAAHPPARASVATCVEPQSR